MMTLPRRIRRAFSLIEVLLAIFILGVGVISIAALFPAGIAQQRASVDDILGPTVANNALSILRMKLKPEDFGTFEQFGALPPRVTIPGDWSWLRPGFMFSAGGGPVNENGAINIFSAGTPDATETASAIGRIPYNATRYDDPATPVFDPTPPRIIITQNERYYPAATQNGTQDVGKPQYVWDCMFRRFQGKIMVAIFVYRVTQPGGGGPLYIVQPNPPPNAANPPLPVWLNVGTPFVACANGPWHPGGPDADITTLVDDDGTANINEANAVILGTQNGNAYDPDRQDMSWQEPRQWILDQNNNVHRVIGLELEDDDGDGLLDIDAGVELMRAVPAMPGTGVNFFPAVPPAAPGSVVNDIWYIPVAVPDANGNLLTLTPVYVTVKEL